MSASGEPPPEKVPRPCVELPTEQELGERYKVSRNTVRLALGLLSNEGIITRTPGRGTFVRDRIMLTYVRTCYSKERPVRLTETIFAGDRNRLVYELGDLDALYERDQ